MNRVEKIITAIAGVLILITPFVLRLAVFREDTPVMDAEFWGVMAMYGLFFGTMLIFCAIGGQRLFDEVNDGSDE